MLMRAHVAVFQFVFAEVIKVIVGVIGVVDVVNVRVAAADPAVVVVSSPSRASLSIVVAGIAVFHGCHCFICQSLGIDNVRPYRRDCRR